MKLLVELRSGDEDTVRVLLRQIGLQQVELEPSFPGARDFARARFLALYVPGNSVEDPLTVQILAHLRAAPQVERVTPEPPLAAP